ncbi:hypothetical protein HO675_06420 [Streptococcus suis]|nr:hypothetical protein [Streptococcus suis]
MLFGISLALTFIVAFIVGNKNTEVRLLNYLLLILLLIDMAYVGIFLLNTIPVFFNKVIKYLENMTSSLDAVILVALITGSISLLNSFYSRYSDNRNKRREYLSTKREEPYSDFVKLVYKISQNGKGGFIYDSEEMIKDINDFNSKLTLWGSPKVVKKWNAFRMNSLETGEQTDPQNILIAMEEVMNEMRKDLGVKSVKVGELLSFFINDVENLITKRK